MSTRILCHCPLGILGIEGSPCTNYRGINYRISSLTRNPGSSLTTSDYVLSCSCFQQLPLPLPQALDYTRPRPHQPATNPHHPITTRQARIGPLSSTPGTSWPGTHRLRLAPGRRRHVLQKPGAGRGGDKKEISVAARVCSKIMTCLLT